MYTYTFMVTVEGHDEYLRKESTPNYPIRFGLPLVKHMPSGVEPNRQTKPKLNMPKTITGKYQRLGEFVYLVENGKEITLQSSAPVSEWDGYTFIFKKKDSCDCGTFHFQFKLLEIN